MMRPRAWHCLGNFTFAQRAHAVNESLADAGRC